MLLQIDLGTAFGVLAQTLGGFGAGVRQKRLDEAALQRAALERALEERRLQQSEAELQFRTGQEERLGQELEFREEQEASRQQRLDEQAARLAEESEGEEEATLAEENLLDEEAATYLRILPPNILQALGDDPARNAVLRIGRQFVTRQTFEDEDIGAAGATADGGGGNTQVTFDSLNPMDQERVLQRQQQLIRGEIDFQHPDVLSIHDQFPTLFREVYMPEVLAERILEEEESRSFRDLGPDDPIRPNVRAQARIDRLPTLLGGGGQ